MRYLLPPTNAQSHTNPSSELLGYHLAKRIYAQELHSIHSLLYTFVQQSIREKLTGISAQKNLYGQKKTQEVPEIENVAEASTATT